VGVLCKEDRQREGNFDLQVRRTYFLKQSAAEYERLLAEHTALRNQVEALEQLPPETVAERERLNAKRDQAYSASMKAGNAGDKAAEKSLYAESSALNKQSEALRDRHLESVKPRIEPLRKRQQEIVVLNQGQEVRVGLAMNVIRLPASGTGSEGGSHGDASPSRSAGLKVNNVVWGVSGSTGALRQALAGAIDQGRLQSLVGKPLPPRAESAALAARVVPAALPAATLLAAPGAVVAAGATAVPQPAGQAAAPTAPPARPATEAAVPAPGAPAASSAQAEGKADRSKQAGELVNKLRGLFGR
jgi:hypothetical protein